MTTEHYEEFTELSGRFISDDLAVDQADDLAITMMCKKYGLSPEYFKGVKDDKSKMHPLR
jgi:hypothetical protein